MSIKKNKSIFACVLGAVSLLLIPHIATAEDSDELQALRTRVEQLEHDAQSDSVVNLAGYGTIGYTDVEGASTGSFNNVAYSPIFHYQFQDKILFEAELELEIHEDGGTEVVVEYATMDWILNDNAVLVVGKFLSPLGFFRQNLHPSWINKLSSAPTGFGHHGAAPIGDVGLQLRGGFGGNGSSRFNYAIYTGNGPELEAEGGEIHALESEGVTRDLDGKAVFGGRIGYLPSPGLEFGISFASGDTTIVEDDGMEVSGDPVRSYDVQGFDFAYGKNGSGNFRVEWISQEIGNAAGSIVPTGGTWEAWYAQYTRPIFKNKWEMTIRLGEFTPLEEHHKQEQTALGLNYLISSNAMFKITFESNDGEAGEPEDQNRTLIQFAYGY